MKYLRVLLGVLTLGLGLGVLGCEKWHEQAVRKNVSDDPADSKLSDVDASIPKGERSSIKSGAWSSQAREIESHFGK